MNVTALVIVLCVLALAGLVWIWTRVVRARKAAARAALVAWWRANPEPMLRRVRDASGRTRTFIRSSNCDPHTLLGALAAKGYDYRTGKTVSTGPEQT
jgi:uncharacterized membrane protein YqiK